MTSPETRAPRGFPVHSSAAIDIQTQSRNRRWPVNITHSPRLARSFEIARGKASSAQKKGIQ
jgi:hypothetical protein